MRCNFARINLIFSSLLVCFISSRVIKRHTLTVFPQLLFRTSQHRRLINVLLRHQQQTFVPHTRTNTQGIPSSTHKQPGGHAPSMRPYSHSNTETHMCKHTHFSVCACVWVGGWVVGGVEGEGAHAVNTVSEWLMQLLVTD